MSWHILLYGDDGAGPRKDAEGLRAQGFAVTVATDGVEVQSFIQQAGLPHVLVVDMASSGTDGVELAKRFAQRAVPVIGTGDRSPTTAIQILLWADDYLGRPFAPEELAARINGVLRRIKDHSYAMTPLKKINERMQVDYARNILLVEGKEVSLTPIEGRLLHTLMWHEGNTVDSRSLLMRVWPSVDVYEDTLRVHIHRLRSKIEIDQRHPQHIVTDRGIGYAFRA
jgi:DNA-binding response OmpR family regulator